MLLGSTVLGAVVSVVFALLVLALDDLRAAADREAAAKDAATLTLELQKLVVDLETGLRGFAITGDERFLEPWRNARAQLGPALDEVVDTAAQEGAAREIAALVDDYLQNYSVPLVAIARESPSAARSREARSEGRRRIEEIRRRFDEFIAADSARVRAATDAAGAQADRAIVLGIVGLLGSAVFIFVVGIYATRSIAHPVSDVAHAATRLAQGELSLRLDERGPGEVGALTRAFNAMARDLQEREQALEARNRSLQESERAKSELVSIVSHEIRTPLASILGFTSVLLGRELHPEHRRYLEIIDTQGKRLGALLDDFLDVQRLEEDRLQLAREEVDLVALLREQVALYAAQSERHRLELDAPGDRLVVEGDPNRLAQVVGNLLSNAIKFSPDGGRVLVSAERENGTARVAVSDEGVGIPPAHRSQLFTKFFRGDAASRGIAGSGLGLALARAIVEAHGGRIAYTTDETSGSTFSIELPTEGDT